MKKSDFKSRKLAYLLKIYQEEITSTQERAERVELIDVNSKETHKFPSLNLAVNHILSALQKPFSSKSITK